MNNIREDVDKLGSSTCNVSSESYIKTTPVSCLFSEFQHLSEEELLKVIKRCPKKSCMLDPMPTWLVKEHINVLIPTLCRLVNMSFQSGVFPDDLQRAIVTPVLKKSLT